MAEEDCHSIILIILHVFLLLPLRPIFRIFTWTITAECPITLLLSRAAGAVRPGSASSRRLRRGKKLLKAVPHGKPSPSPRLPLRSRYPPPLPAPFIRRDRKDSNRQEIPIPALWYDRIGKVPAAPAAIGLGARGPASSLPPTSRNSDGKGGKWNRNGSPARAARRKPGMSGGSDRRPS